MFNILYYMLQETKISGFISTNSQFQDLACISQHQPRCDESNPQVQDTACRKKEICQTVPTVYTKTSASNMHNTTYLHLNLSHQYHHPNLIYSQISIIKSTLNHMNNITKLTNKIPLEIHHSLHKPKTINPYTIPCAKSIPLIL
jgi:hypothetical protein